MATAAALAPLTANTLTATTAITVTPWASFTRSAVAPLIDKSSTGTAAPAAPTTGQLWPRGSST